MFCIAGIMDNRANNEFITTLGFKYLLGVKLE